MTLHFGIDNASYAAEQAAQTAEQYADAAFKYLKDNPDVKGWSSEAKATFVAGFMNAAAKDFHASATLSGFQKLDNAIDNLSTNLQG